MRRWRSGPFPFQTLWDWHRILVASADLDDRHKGAWRDRLGWVGGPTPQRAAQVATPADRIDVLMRDLVDYANSPKHDPVTATALIHAQFETIHPFADANGDIGRLLTGWMLHRRLDLVDPPPVSVAFLRDVGGYLTGLTLYRTVGPDEWVRWFAHTLERLGHFRDGDVGGGRRAAGRVADSLGGNPVRCGGASIARSRRYAPEPGCGDRRGSTRCQPAGGPGRAGGPSGTFLAVG